MNKQAIYYDFHLKSDRKYVHRRKFLVSIILTVILIVFIICITPSIAVAESNKKSVKTMTTVQIQKGDTIWSIAEEFYTSECGKFRNYVDEIMKSNGLHSDIIYPGNYLIVPYYVKE